MKKVRAAAVLAVAMTAASQAKEFAREHPEQAGETLDKVEQYLRARLTRHGADLDKGSRALRQGLGLPATGAAPGVGLTDPDPDTASPLPSTGSATRWRRTRHRAPVMTRSRVARTTTRHH